MGGEGGGSPPGRDHIYIGRYSGYLGSPAMPRGYLDCFNQTTIYPKP